MTLQCEIFLVIFHFILKPPKSYYGVGSHYSFIVSFTKFHEVLSWSQFVKCRSYACGSLWYLLPWSKGMDGKQIIFLDVQWCIINSQASTGGASLIQSPAPQISIGLICVWSLPEWLWHWVLSNEGIREWSSEGNFAVSLIRARFFLQSQIERLEVKNTEQQHGWKWSFS